MLIAMIAVAIMTTRVAIETTRATIASFFVSRRILSSVFPPTGLRSHAADLAYLAPKHAHLFQEMLQFLAMTINLVICGLQMSRLVTYGPTKEVYLHVCKKRSCHISAQCSNILHVDGAEYSRTRRLGRQAVQSWP